MSKMSEREREGRLVRRVERGGERERGSHTREKVCADTEYTIHTHARANRRPCRTRTSGVRQVYGGGQPQRAPCRWTRPHATPRYTAQ